jgi:hypothetical protein
LQFHGIQRTETVADFLYVHCKDLPSILMQSIRMKNASKHG